MLKTADFLPRKQTAAAEQIAEQVTENVADRLAFGRPTIPGNLQQAASHLLAILDADLPCVVSR